MDIPTIDARYSQLQTAAQAVGQTITDLATKLQTAAAAGDQNAREWLLDLKNVALGVRDEQDQANNLLTAMHDFIVNTLQSPPTPAAAPVAPEPVYQQPQPVYQQPYGGGGYGGGYGGGFGGAGMLQHFRGSGFGRAIAMGAGFGLGDDLINKIL